MKSKYEALSPDVLQSRLSSATRTWLRELRVHEEIDSTNSHLMSRASAEDIDGIVCLAERQTSGRGRRGRTWITPTGTAIALSMGRRVTLALQDVAPLSLVVGVAVAHAMRRSAIAGVTLKWPNDVLLDGIKVGGVLIELPNSQNSVVAVIGIGINVGAGAEVSARLGTAVGDVLDKNRHVSRNKLAADIIDVVHRSVTDFESDGFARMKEEWQKLHAYEGVQVRVTSADWTVEGIARGITMNGELLLETSAGLRRFSGGEVSLRASTQ